MIKLGFYRVLTLILLPVGVLFGLFALMMLMVALSNPPMLLPVFAVACVSIYIFTSFKFLNKGVLQGRQCKASLRDWIKVNAIVSVIFSAMLLINVSAMISNPELLNQALDQSIAMQGGTAAISKADLLTAGRWMMYFLAALGILLLVHIFISFRLLKQYRERFEDLPADND